MTRRLCLLVLSLILLGVSNSVSAEPNIYPNSDAIIQDLLAKAEKIDTLAQDYIIEGKVVKRMSFQFKKDNKPFFRFKSEYIRNGQKYVFYANADGEHDFDYYPSTNSLVRTKKSPKSWNEQSYQNARAWFFAYKDEKVIGEDVVDGKPCYILLSESAKSCVAKDTGIALELRYEGGNNPGSIYYGNFSFNLPDSEFEPPTNAKVVDK